MTAGSSESYRAGSGTKWALGALGLFVVTEAILLVAGEDPYLVSTGCLTILLAVAGWAIGHYRSMFERSLGELTAISKPRLKPCLRGHRHRASPRAYDIQGSAPGVKITMNLGQL